MGYKLETPITILVRRRAALGDVVIVTGVIRELKRKYGDNCMIDIITDNPSVFDGNPHVRRVYDVHGRPDPSAYNIYYNLDDTYELNPEGHFADNYFYRVFGSTDYDRSMELFVDDMGISMVDDIINHIDGDYVCIHMRNWHWELKNIKFDVWGKVINKLQAANPNVKIVCVGGPTDIYPAGHPGLVDARGLTPSALCYLMDHAKCFVGIDSAPFHIAGASETHIVALLSHMHPDKVLPYRNGEMGHNCTVIQADVPCLGCHSRQPRPVSRIVCERSDYACNTLWDTDKIALAIIKQL